MATVDDVYAQYLGRTPDAGAVDYWQSLFGPTMEPNEIATFLSVANVTEPTAAVQAAVQSYTPTAAPATAAPAAPSTPTAPARPSTVNDLYQTFYGTPGDAGGLAYWGGADKAIAPKDAASWLLWAGKDPSIANKSTGLTVDQAYETYLGFKPDETARNYWTGGDPNKELTTAELAAITSEAYGLNSKDSDFLSSIGSGISDFAKSDLGKLALVAGSLYAGGVFDPSTAAAAGGGGSAAGGSTLLDFSFPTSTGGLGLQGTAALDGTLASGLAAPAGGSLGGGLGLNAATAGNLAAMGGAQGLLANAAGGGTLSAGGVNTGLFTADNLAKSISAAGIGSVPTTTGAGAANPLTNLTPDQVTTLAKAGINVAGILGAGAAVKGITNNLTNTGGGMLTQQDRSGVSSGSAQYSPEYYQAIQAKYNQMMPQQPRDVTTDLKSWYETKYAPKVA